MDQSGNDLEKQVIGTQKNTKLNIESFSFMIFFIFAMYFISTMPNTGPNLIQKVLIGIWLFIFIGILHKNEKFNLFGDNFPVEEGTKLTLIQKISIGFLSLFIPSLVVIATTLIWYKKNPFKARRANVIAMIVYVGAFSAGWLTGWMQYK